MNDVSVERRLSDLEKIVTDHTYQIAALRQSITAGALDITADMRDIRDRVDDLARRFEAMERRIERLFAGAAAISGLAVLLWTVVSPFLSRFFP